MGAGRGAREMGKGVGRVRVNWVGKEARKIVIGWYWKLAFVDGFSMFSASVGALSEVCFGSEHVFEH